MRGLSFIIRDEPFDGGLFPRLPSPSRVGSYLVLYGGKSIPLVVNEQTTVHQIRQGKYTRFVEISSAPAAWLQDYHVPCAEPKFTVHVTISGDVRVVQPGVYCGVAFPVNIVEFLDHNVLPDIQRASRRRSYTEQEELEGDLAGRMSILARDPGIEDLATGLRYRIHTVLTDLDEDARNDLQRHKKIDIDERYRVTVMSQTQMVQGMGYADAVWEQVIKGELTEEEAIKKINQWDIESFEKRVEEVRYLREHDFLSEEQAKAIIQPNLMLGTPVIAASAEPKALQALEWEPDQVDTLLEDVDVEPNAEPKLLQASEWEPDPVDALLTDVEPDS